MPTPSTLSLGRHTPAFDVPRDDVGGRAEADQHRHHDDDRKDRNVLQGAEAIALVQTIRSKALRQPLPDSTPMIRADREER